MYHDDICAITQYVTGPSGVFRVGQFVLATINRHFAQVPQVLADYDQGFSSRYMSRGEHRYVATMLAKANDVYCQLCQWRRHGKNAPYYAIRDLVEYPGLGITKAAFMAQLLLPWTDVGCLDRHLMRLYGLNEDTFVRKPASAEGLSCKIQTYLGLCKQLGGAEKLWNDWCRQLAVLRPQSFESADAVSKLHVSCITR